MFDRPETGVRYALQPHPSLVSSPIEAIDVTIARTHADRIAFTYHVLGDVAAVSWPMHRAGGPTQVVGLWEHSCFEAFVRPAARGRYVELNFAPSGQWMAGLFAEYRGEMQDSGSELNALTWRIDVPGGRAELSADVSFRVLGDAAAMLNLTAVIEATDGTKSYWALAHAPGPPDFHNPACFTATLPPLGRP